MEFVIRPVKSSDAAGINTLRRMPGVRENTLGNPSERVKMSEDWIDGLGKNDFHFVAVVQENGSELLVGYGGLTASSHPRLRHSGDLGIMIHKDYQNRGIGSALMEAILDMADHWLMLVRVELTVFCDNDRAVHLYEKYGFQKEGVKRLGAIRQGRYTDEFIMARIRE